jgi:hypothetical protein
MHRRAGWMRVGRRGIGHPVPLPSPTPADSTCGAGRRTGCGAPLTTVRRAATPPGNGTRRTGLGT